MIDPNRIWSSAQLPSLPMAALRLVEMSREPGADIAEYIRVIQADPAIAARVLRAANSSYFGLTCKVQSVDRAVMLLGKTAVVALALGFSLVEGADQGRLGEAYKTFWLQSTVQAAAGAVLADELAPNRADDMLLVGLLLDLGRLAMLRTIPKDYLPVVEAAEAWQRPLHELEQEVLGISHLEVGRELLRRWKLPQALELSLCLHHAPWHEFQRDEESPDELEQARLAAIAAAAGDYFCGPTPGLALERLRCLAREFYHWNEERVRTFVDQVRAQSEETAALFSIDTQALATPADLLARANEQLAMLAMTAQAESAQARARQEAIEHEIRALERRNEQLLHQAQRDPLTRVYNRQFFDETLVREMQRRVREAEPLGVIFFDVDHFKKLNDTCGHACGDEVLKTLTKVVSEVLRGTDVLARYGGEEFIVLVTDPTEKGLERLADRIRSRVEEEVFRFAGKRLPVTVSVGAALSLPGPDHPHASSELVEAADAAMYEAKTAGRNQVRFRCLMSEFDRKLMRAVNQSRFSRWLVSRGILDLTNVSRALLHSTEDRAPLGELAQRLGLLTEAEVQRIVAGLDATSRFGQTGVRLGLITARQLVTLLAVQQENHRELALNLVRLELVDAIRIQQLLEEYELEHNLVRSMQPA